LGVYHEQTQPLVDYYSDDALESPTGIKFSVVSGVGALYEVKQRISEALDS
jgi:adenylate kinase